MFSLSLFLLCTFHELALWLVYFVHFAAQPFQASALHSAASLLSNSLTNARLPIFPERCMVYTIYYLILYVLITYNLDVKNYLVIFSFHDIPPNPSALLLIIQIQRILTQIEFKYFMQKGTFSLSSPALCNHSSFWRRQTGVFPSRQSKSSTPCTLEIEPADHRWLLEGGNKEN